MATSDHIVFLQDRITKTAQQWDEYLDSKPIEDEFFEAKQEQYNDWMERASDALNSMLREQATIERGNP